MKCPKCGYHSFEHLENCKKCGQNLVEHKTRYGLRGLFFLGKTDQPPKVALDSPSKDESDVPGETASSEDAVNFGFDFITEDSEDEGANGESAHPESPSPVMAGKAAAPDIDEEPTFEIEDDWLLETKVEPGPSQQAETPSAEQTESWISDAAEEGVFAQELDLGEVDDDSDLPSVENRGSSLPEPRTGAGDEEPGTALDPLPSRKTAEELAAEEADFWIEEDLSEPSEPPEEEIDLTELFGDAAEEESAEEHPAEDLPFLNLSLPQEGPGSTEITEVSPLKNAAEELTTAEDLPAREGIADTLPFPNPVAEISTSDPADDEEGGTLAGGTGFPAAVAARMGAFLFDLVILSVTFFLFIVAGEWALNPAASGMGLIPSPRAFLDLSTPYFLVLFILVFAYFTLFHFLTGQTPGKMVFRVRVESARGASLTLSQAFLRSVGGLFAFLPAGLGFLSILFARQGRGWNDRLGGSRVIKVVSGSGLAPKPDEGTAG